MITAISSSISTSFEWMGKFLTALTTTTGALYPLLSLVGISVGIAVIFLGFRAIRSVLWGF